MEKTKNIFRVEFKNKSTLQKSSFILVHLISEELEFELTDNTTLGGIPVQKTFSVPRAKANEGKIHLIGFFPKNKQDLDKLEIGQVVELIP